MTLNDYRQSKTNQIDYQLELAESVWSGMIGTLAGIMDNFLERWIPQEMISILQQPYAGQRGEIFRHLWTNTASHVTGAVGQGCVLSRRLFCDVVEFALDSGGMPLDKLASIWRKGPHFVWLTLSKWHSDFWRFLPAHVTNARDWPIHWWYIWRR